MSGATLLYVNLGLNLIGATGVIFCSAYIMFIKNRLRKREEELNKRLDHLMLLSDKLIEHTTELKDKEIVFDPKELTIGSQS